MRRGTTPTLVFTVPDILNPMDFDVLSIAFAQNGEFIFDKRKNDCLIDGQSIILTLTQADTLKLQGDKSVEIQLRAGIGQLRYASKIIKTTVGRILMDGEI